MLTYPISRCRHVKLWTSEINPPVFLYSSKTLFKITFKFKYVYLVGRLPMNAYRSYEKMWDDPELEKQAVVVSHLMWVLGIELGSFCKSSVTLNA